MSLDSILFGLYAVGFALFPIILAILIKFFIDKHLGWEERE